MVQFHALGGVSVTREGCEVNVGGPRQRRLLAMLLVNRNTIVSVDRLADAVFAGEPTQAASTTLRSYVARIRKVVETEGDVPVVTTQAPGYLLRLPDEAFDVARFESALARGRALSGVDATAAATELRCALELWRGDAYAEFDDEDWVQPEARRLAELRLVATELLLDAELEAGRAADVIPEIQAMVRHHPLREGFVAQLMLALYRNGRQADALRAFGQHREVLVQEVGLDPTPALCQLEARILAHDPDLQPHDQGGQALRGYRLGDRLGTGQDGTVHAAHLPGVERDLVIRVVRPQLADAPGFVRSFESTAQRLAALRHPAIVPIHDYWREPGAAYLVMRRMHGGSLADRLERRALTVADVTAIVRRVGAALIAAHEADLVHGRVSPRSVLFDEAGDAWLSDFDVAGGPARPADIDVGDLAALVRDCLPDAPGAVTVAVERGVAGDVPGIEEHVAELVAALTGIEVDAAVAAPNPYKGLSAFDESDAADFFGRTDVVDDVLHRLAHDDLRGRLVLVVGGSGTGKSSVVRAGLLPRIRGGHAPGSAEWFVTTMLPGATPFKELAAALRRVAVADIGRGAEELATERGLDTVVRRCLPPGGQLLLVVDQLEELFTSASERDQRRFLDGLWHAVTAPDSRVRVIGTLRADFYDRPLAVRPFGAAVNDATVTIPAMSAADLEAAIVEPAERVGRHVDRALVAELVNAAIDEPAGLPALQFTLFELAQREAGDLTRQAYRDLGGLSGAIASRAEALYRSLEDDDRAAVRRLFAQLVAVHPDGEPTRRRATRVELTADEPTLDALIDRWADARLLSLDRHRQSRLPTVEPAHEALLREWPRLRRWITEDGEALLVHRHLREATAGWLEVDRDGGALYRGARLQVAIDVLGSARLGPQEREFLDASRAAHDAEARDAAAQVERQAQANRRLRLQLAVIGIALAIALIGGAIAVDQRGEAVEGRRIAFAGELAAAADAALDEDPERSMLLALEAISVAKPGDDTFPQAISVLHHAISQSRTVHSFPGLGGNLDWSPDGSLFVTEGPEESGLVDVRDAGTGESVRSWTGHEIDINEVIFDTTGDLLATSGDDGYLRVWETASGDEVGAFGHAGLVRGPAFSPDGHLVAAAWHEDRPEQAITTVRVIDRATAEVLASVEVEFSWDTDFSPDGRHLVIPSVAGEGIVVIDARTGEQVLGFGQDLGNSRDASYSADGRWIATGHHDGIARIWDARTGEQRFTVAAHTSEVNAVEWSPDGSRLATAAQDGVAKVHEVTAGGVRTLVGVSARDTANGLAAIAFSPDGEQLMTGDWGLASVKVWDVSEQASGELANVPTDPFASGSGSFAGDRRTVVAMDEDGDVARWDIETGKRLGEVDVDGDAAERIAVSPDGHLVVAGGGRGLILYDLRTGERLARVTGADDGYPVDVAWSRDGDHLAVSLYDRAELLVVDRSGAEVARIAEDPGYFATTVAFTGDGDQLVTSREVPRPAVGAVGIRVWDWRRGEPTLDLPVLGTSVSADPTGDRIVFTQQMSGEAEIWDIRSGEQVRVLRGGGVANSVQWSLDGGRVAMAGADGTVRVFDPDTGRLELTLRGHTRAVNTTSFSVDGTRLASLDESGLVRVWALELDELVAIARDRLTRELDADECRQYLRGDRCDRT